MQKVIFRTVWQIVMISVTAFMLGFLTNQIRSDRISLVADWSLEAQLGEESGQNMVISIEEARGNFFSRKTVFLDARSPQAFKEGHIQGARNLPWEGVEKYFETTMAGIPPDALIITYCDGESCSLSKDLALELFFKGYENVRVLVNGWSVWVEQQLPVSKYGESDD